MTDATSQQLITTGGQIVVAVIGLLALRQSQKNAKKADAILTQGDGHTTMLTEALEKSHSDAADVAAKASDGKDALIDRLIRPDGSKGDRAGDPK